jgi:hypothetical protein
MDKAECSDLSDSLTWMCTYARSAAGWFLDGNLEEYISGTTPTASRPPLLTQEGSYVTFLDH